jgi:hypothetical protein
MNEIIVGIGRYAHRSVDGGSTWAKAPREIPGKHTPIVRGTVDLAGLPSRPPGTIWDAVSVLPDGFGLAVNHETTNSGPGSTNAPSSLAHVFRTNDGGRTWREQALKVRWKLTQAIRRATLSWPVEEFTSLALPQPRRIVALQRPRLHQRLPGLRLLRTIDNSVRWFSPGKQRRRKDVGQANVRNRVAP